MKKISIIALVFSLFFITGCGCSKKELKTVTCSLNQKYDNYDYEVQMVFEYDDKKIKNYERIENIVLTDETMASSYNGFLEYMERFDEEIDNYDYDYKIDKEKIETELNVDFEKVDIEKILGAPGLYKEFYDYDNKIFDIDLALDVLMNDDDYKGLKCE